MNNLKKYLAWLAIPLICCWNTSCDDNEDRKSDFHILGTTFSKTSDKVEGTIRLSSDNFEYSVSKEWCIVEKNGTILNVRSGPNYDFESRNAEIVIGSGDKLFKVPVTQTGTLLSVQLGYKDNYLFGKGGGSVDVKLVTNVNFEIIVSDSDSEWLSAEKTANNEIKINVANDPGLSRGRQGRIILKYFEREYPIAVSQILSLSYNELLGLVKIYYTNKNGERKETEGLLTEYEHDKKFWLTASFDDKSMTYQLPMEYHPELAGELRFILHNIDENFVDPDYRQVNKLTLMMYSLRFSGSAFRPSESMYYGFGSSTQTPNPMESHSYRAKPKYSDGGTLYQFMDEAEGEDRNETIPGITKPAYGPPWWYFKIVAIGIIGSRNGESSVGESYEFMKDIDLIR